MEKEKAETIVTLIERLVFEIDEDDVTAGDIIDCLTYNAWDAETAGQLQRTKPKPVIVNFS